MTEDPSQPQWSVLRAAILRVGKPPQPIGFTTALGDATVRTRDNFSKDGEPMGTMALVQLPVIAWSVDHLPALPTVEREQSEFALEIACRMLALDQGVEHSMVSPKPCFALHCTDSSAMAALDGVTVDNPWPAFSMSGSGPAGLFEDPKYLDLLRDRLDGVVMVTEAINAGRTVGQFTQFWRFFERAFHAGHTEALPHLQAFLVGGDFHGFSPDEVARWMDARNPSVHANRAGDITLDSDVFLILGY